MVLTIPVNELGKPGVMVFLEFCPQAQISKTLTPGDLENEVATPQS